MDTSSENNQKQNGPDSELFIRRCFETDARLGCEMLFRRYYTALCHHAVRIVGSKLIAENLVIDVFCQFYEHQIFNSITTSYRAYLYKTIQNRAFSYERQTYYQNLSSDKIPFYLTPDPKQPDTIIKFDKLYHRFEKALKALSTMGSSILHNVRL